MVAASAPYFFENADKKNSAFPPPGKSSESLPRPIGVRGDKLLYTQDDRAATVQKRKTQRRTGGKSIAESAQLRPVGVIRSTLRSRRDAPKQGHEGAPDAWLEIHSFALDALDGVAPGDELLILTWFHQANRQTLKVHPRSNPSRRLTGVFATRSPDRPNPIGLHRVTVRKIATNRLRIGPIEAIDGTPVVDIKPALTCAPAF
jgi:tRNA-Thr(GGU) m(6)t(6)A37 methyltransferase TsaA